MNYGAALPCSEAVTFTQFWKHPEDALFSNSLVLFGWCTWAKFLHVTFGCQLVPGTRAPSWISGLKSKGPHLSEDHKPCQDHRIIFWEISIIDWTGGLDDFSTRIVINIFITFKLAGQIFGFVWYDIQTCLNISSYVSFNYISVWQFILDSNA